jgi:hypothetical protein
VELIRFAGRLRELECSGSRNHGKTNQTIYRRV